MTWTKVTIENDEATAFYQNKAYRRAPAKALISDAVDESGLWPPGLLWLSEDRSMVVIERPPAYRSIAYAPTYRDSAKNHKVFRIPVPWQIYVVTLRGTGTPSLRAYCRPGPVTDPGDKLFVYPLPNVGPDGSVCMHVETQWPPFIKGNPPLAARVTFMINAMWMSGFNHNMGNVMGDTNRHAVQFRAAIRGLTDMQVLAKLEDVTLEEVVKWTYPDAGTTVASFMSGGGGRKKTGLVEQLASRIMGSGY